MLTANRLGIWPGLHRRDFQLIAQNGFGDGNNAYAHSMAWFDGHLYVGTTRGNFPFMKARLPIGMDVWPVECPEDPYSIDMHAEIWRYDPLTGKWERVFKAPTIIGTNGRPIPRELGLRGMLVYSGRRVNGPSEKPALFVSTWSPARGPGPTLLRSEDGHHFEPTCEPGLTGLPVTTIRTVCEFKGRLFTTPAGSRGGNPNVSAHSVVYESTDPSKGVWEPCSDFGFGDPGNKTIFEMCPWGDHLYVGTFNLEGFQVWRSTMEGERPYRFERVLEKGAYRGKLNQCVLSMTPFKGALYIGSGIQGGGVDTQNRIGPAPPELIRLWPDGSWDLLVGDERDTPVGHKVPLSGYMPGFNNFFNGYFWRMVEHEGWLYLGTFEWSTVVGYANRRKWPETFTNVINYVGAQYILDHHSGFDLYRSFDGANWVPVTNSGMGNPYNMGLRTLVSSPYGLFLGTANPYGPKVMPLNGDRYVNNPRGGCEIYFAPNERGRAVALDAARG